MKMMRRVEIVTTHNSAMKTKTGKTDKVGRFISPPLGKHWADFHTAGKGEMQGQNRPVEGSRWARLRSSGTAGFAVEVIAVEYEFQRADDHAGNRMLRVCRQHGRPAKPVGPQRSSFEEGP
jgi:hypothetical protein